MNKTMKQHLREAIDATIEVHRDGATADEQAAAQTRLEEAFHAFVCAKAKTILGESSEEHDEDDDCEDEREDRKNDRDHEEDHDEHCDDDEDEDHDDDDEDEDEEEDCEDEEEMHNTMKKKKRMSKAK